MTEALWWFSDILGAVGGKSICSERNAITGISIDTRTLNSGDMFVAIKGDNFDGHQFVEKAFEQGAVCAIVSAEHIAPGASGPLILVEDTLQALNRLGSAARERSRGKIIAVTGSVGKTGTKEALRLSLVQSGLTHWSEKSYNNHWGVPLSLSRMPVEAEFGIFEVGMNHPGEITPLTQMIKPHIAIVTTVEPVHLGFFKSVEEIAEAKAEIFSGLVPGGFAILNSDNPYFDLLHRRATEAGAEIIAFGSSDTADVRVLSQDLSSTGSKVLADVMGHEIAYEIGAPGRHFVMNSLGVLAAVNCAGADLELAARSLSELVAQKGRGQRQIIRTPDGEFTVIDESYNANPASVRAALEAMTFLPKLPESRRIAVLGDMLELGDKAPELHRSLAVPVKESEIDIVFACGPEMSHLYDVLPTDMKGGYSETSTGLVDMLKNEIRPGDTVMIKGSLGSKMGLLVEMLTGMENR